MWYKPTTFSSIVFRQFLSSFNFSFEIASRLLFAHFFSFFRMFFFFRLPEAYELQRCVTCVCWVALFVYKVRSFWVWLFVCLCLSWSLSLSLSLRLFLFSPCPLATCWIVVFSLYIPMDGTNGWDVTYTTWWSLSCKSANKIILRWEQRTHPYSRRYLLYQCHRLMWRDILSSSSPFHTHSRRVLHVLTFYFIFIFCSSPLLDFFDWKKDEKKKNVKKLKMENTKRKVSLCPLSFPPLSLPSHTLLSLIEFFVEWSTNRMRVKW